MWVTGSIEVARASNGKLRNKRKIGNHGPMDLGVVEEVNTALGKDTITLSCVAGTLFVISDTEHESATEHESELNFVTLRNPGSLFHSDSVRFSPGIGVGSGF